MLVEGGPLMHIRTDLGRVRAAGEPLACERGPVAAAGLSRTCPARGCLWLAKHAGVCAVASATGLTLSITGYLGNPGSTQAQYL